MSRKNEKPGGKTARSSKVRVRKQPKPHVVSLRMNDQERELLEQVSQKRGQNVSAMVREALEHWLARELRPALRATRHRPPAGLPQSYSSSGRS